MSQQRQRRRSSPSHRHMPPAGERTETAVRTRPHTLPRTQNPIAAVPTLPTCSLTLQAHGAAQQECCYRVFRDFSAPRQGEAGFRAHPTATQQRRQDTSSALATSHTRSLAIGDHPGNVAEAVDACCTLPGPPAGVLSPQAARAWPVRADRPDKPTAGRKAAVRPLPEQQASPAHWVDALHWRCSPFWAITPPCGDSMYSKTVKALGKNPFSQSPPPASATNMQPSPFSLTLTPFYAVPYLTFHTHVLPPLPPTKRPTLPPHRNSQLDDSETESKEGGEAVMGLRPSDVSNPVRQVRSACTSEQSNPLLPAALATLVVQCSSQLDPRAPQRITPIALQLCA
jgi:hypothetical protein